MRFSLALSVVVLGCSSKSEPATGGTDPCANSIVAPDPFVAGVTKKDVAGKIQVKLLDALPAPPDLGDNQWTVQVLDASGKPRVGSTVSEVRPWMPNHGHGSTTLRDVGKVDGTGKLVIDKVELVMPGVWTVAVCVDGQPKEQAATFAFCIEG